MSCTIVKYCKYDSGLGGGAPLKFVLWEVGGFLRNNNTIAFFIKAYVLESLTVTYHSFT